MPNTLSGSGSELPRSSPSPNGAGEASGGARADFRGRLHPLLQWTRRTALKFGGGARWAPGTVAVLMRSEPLVSPLDSIASVHATLRRAPSAALCVGLAGRVFGTLTLDALDRVLASNMKYIGGSGTDPAQMPLSALLEGPEPLLTLGAIVRLSDSDTLDHARALLAAREDAPLAVVCAPGETPPVYQGLVYRSDFVAAALGNLAPVRVGGMATPLGVYLTDGVVQGGAGNLGLVLAGASMATLFAAALAVSSVGLDWMQRAWHFDLTRMIALAFLQLVPNHVFAMRDDLQASLAAPLLLVFLRLVPVSGYHAAEHQVVHCLERGLPLIPKNVRSMPRVHPRCGTNLVAGLGILTFSLGLAFALTGSIYSAVLPSVVVTLLTWRPIGSALQQFLTTRPASDKQIASGIRAGEQVMRRSLEAGLERRPTLVQRVWNMGLVQLMAGAYLVIAILGLISVVFPAAGQYLNGLN